MDPELAALGGAAATALVQQLTTESWTHAQTAVRALWRRARPGQEQAVAAELAEARQAALRARRDGDEDAERALAAAWRERLEQLLTASPGIARDLDAQVHEWQRSAAPSERSEIRVHASGRSRVTVAGRDLHINERP